MTTSERLALRERALSMLVDEALHGAAESRANAVEALSAAPRRLDEVLPEATRDPNLGVRAVAATVIGRHKLSRHRGRLLPLLNDSDARVASSAAYALAELGDPSHLRILATSLEDDRVDVRAHAAFLIGESGDRSAAAMLREAMQRPPARAPRPRVRVLELQIAEALIKLGDSASVDAVRAALYPSQPQDLEAAALAAQILGQVGDAGARDQLVYLTAEWDANRRYMPAEIRLAAAGALAKLGLDRGSFIAEPYLTDPNETLRAQAAYVLGDAGGARSVGLLAPLLEDQSPRVRVAAAGAIVRAVPG